MEMIAKITQGQIRFQGEIVDAYLWAAHEARDITLSPAQQFPAWFPTEQGEVYEVAGSDYATLRLKVPQGVLQVPPATWVLRLTDGSWRLLDADATVVDVDDHNVAYFALWREIANQGHSREAVLRPAPETGMAERFVAAQAFTPNLEATLQEVRRLVLAIRAADKGASKADFIRQLGCLNAKDRALLIALNALNFDARDDSPIGALLEMFP